MRFLCTDIVVYGLNTDITNRDVPKQNTRIITVAQQTETNNKYCYKTYRRETIKTENKSLLREQECDKNVYF